MTVTKLSARKSKITVPERCDPRAKIVFAEMRAQAQTYDEIEWKSGVLRSTVKAWRRDNKPGLDTMDAVLGALGWELIPTPKPERLDPALRVDLEAVAEKHGLDVIPHRELIAACIGYRHPNSHIDARGRRKNETRAAHAAGKFTVPVAPPAPVGSSGPVNREHRNAT